MNLEKIFGFNPYRILIAIALIAVLSAFQHNEDIKTIMFIVSAYLVSVFLFATFKIIKKWFIK